MQEKTQEKKKLKAELQTDNISIVQRTPFTKTTKPISRSRISSGFSINSFLNKENKIKTEEEIVIKAENIPQNYFTNTDLQIEWNSMLKQLQIKNNFIFNAIKNFKMVKENKHKIRVLFPSDSAKVEFDKISEYFFNHCKRKFQNDIIEIEYVRDIENLKIEVVTKKKIFEKFIEKNPLLKDLDDLMKFDLR